MKLGRISVDRPLLPPLPLPGYTSPMGEGVRGQGRRWEREEGVREKGERKKGRTRGMCEVH